MGLTVKVLKYKTILISQNKRENQAEIRPDRTVQASVSEISDVGRIPRVSWSGDIPVFPDSGTSSLRCSTARDCWSGKRESVPLTKIARLPDFLSEFSYIEVQDTSLNPNFKIAPFKTR
jgi:hypothetical protein